MSIDIEKVAKEAGLDFNGYEWHTNSMGADGVEPAELQAFAAAIIEQCALACLAVMCHDESAAVVAVRCAAAIRALKPPT